jgi:hypothetical protein
MPADRRALIVGINQYAAPGLDLQAAVPDARGIAALLRRHADDTPNYDCRLLTDTMEDGTPITRAALRRAVREVFADYDGDVLLYFSGHGVLTKAGGYLCTADAETDDWGIPMDEVVGEANRSKARDILLILDCCHSGQIANPALLQPNGADPLALLREDMTVIAASRPPQEALEAGGHGLFTRAILDALDGGAADHLGWVTAPAIYGYAERRFGAFDQRPVYKSHTTRFTVVRQCAPLIERFKLARLVELFPAPDHRYPLERGHEPEDEHGNVTGPVDAEKVAIATLFKEYRDAGLVRATVPGEDFYWVARRSHTVELTLRGREYWRLVRDGRI